MKSYVGLFVRYLVIGCLLTLGCHWITPEADCKGMAGVNLPSLVNYASASALGLGENIIDDVSLAFRGHKRLQYCQSASDTKIDASPKKSLSPEADKFERLNRSKGSESKSGAARKGGIPKRQCGGCWYYPLFLQSN